MERRWKNHFFTVGTYGMRTNIFPAGNRNGPADRFTDLAFDAQYQFMGTIEADHMQMPMGNEPAAKPMPMPMGNEPMAKPMPMGNEPAAQAGEQPMAKAGKHMVTAHVTWIYESQDWKASFPLGNAANPSDSLNTFRMNLNYYYRSHLGDMGGSIGNFFTTGKTDQLLYSPIPVDGSRTGNPDSNGLILEADYRPSEKTKISLQYIIYNKFNGAHADYDGFGRNASDNNTLYAVVWFMF